MKFKVGDIVRTEQSGYRGIHKNQIWEIIKIDENWFADNQTYYTIRLVSGEMAGKKDVVLNKICFYNNELEKVNHVKMRQKKK